MSFERPGNTLYHFIAVNILCNDIRLSVTTIHGFGLQGSMTASGHGSL